MSNLERRIYVGGLAESINEELLYSIFLTFGNVRI